MAFSHAEDPAFKPNKAHAATFAPATGKHVPTENVNNPL